METRINGTKVVSKYQGQLKQPIWHRPNEPRREHFQITVFGVSTHECFDLWQPNGKRSMKEEDLLEAVEMIASDALTPEEFEDAAEFLVTSGYNDSEDYIRNGLQAWGACKQTAEAFKRLGIDPSGFCRSGTRTSIGRRLTACRAAGGPPPPAARRLVNQQQEACDETNNA